MVSFDRSQSSTQENEKSSELESLLREIRDELKLLNARIESGFETEITKEDLE